MSSSSPSLSGALRWPARNESRGTYRREPPRTAANRREPSRTAAERAVARVDSMRLSALLVRDTGLVRRIHAEDFRSILPSGAVRTKADFLRDLASGAQPYDTVRHAEQRIEVVGDVAIITGRSTQAGHVRPPSVDLNTPRIVSATTTWPIDPA
jgi:hypothetical protein